MRKAVFFFSTCLSHSLGRQNRSHTTGEEKKASRKVHSPPHQGKEDHTHRGSRVPFLPCFSFLLPFSMWGVGFSSMRYRGRVK